MARRARRNGLGDNQNGFFEARIEAGQPMEVCRMFAVGIDDQGGLACLGHCCPY